jgi:hypothetical protein
MKVKIFLLPANVSTITGSSGEEGVGQRSPTLYFIYSWVQTRGLAKIQHPSVPFLGGVELVIVMVGKQHQLLVF